MNLKNSDVWLGIGTVLFGIFLLFVAIPAFVSSPSNVPKIVLSPTFWPTIIAYLIIILGIVLTLTRLFAKPAPAATEPTGDALEDPSQPWVRLLATAIVMFALIWAIPYFGMVWSSMVAFVAIAFIVKTPKPVTSLIVAIILPLVLYAFFNHVAGVAVPQGRFITLP
ncbi:MAG: tripartite tricarboxylate transporter TctB family protein [Filomicrobium sp.]